MTTPRLAWQALGVARICAVSAGSALPRVDVLVNSPGAWATVRTDQPFAALQRSGWDVRVHTKPFLLQQVVRPASLVVWQRPLPDSVAQWLAVVAWIRAQGCLLLVEWDDHPDLFPPGIRAKGQSLDWLQLRCAHGLQASSLQLHRVLRGFHPAVWLLENAVDPVPPLRWPSASEHARIFLANFNREAEHRRLARVLADWLCEADGPTLVTLGSSGLDGLMPMQRWERHPVQPYEQYRRLLSSCDVALLPLDKGEAQACKTAIKWQEAAAESVAVVAGPELYGPWCADGRYGICVSSVDEVIPEARDLVCDLPRRQLIVADAHARVSALQLQRQLLWRMELYQRLWRLRPALDRQLLMRYPQLESL